MEKVGKCERCTNVRWLRVYAWNFFFFWFVTGVCLMESTKANRGLDAAANGDIDREWERWVFFFLCVVLTLFEGGIYKLTMGWWALGLEGKYNPFFFSLKQFLHKHRTKSMSPPDVTTHNPPNTISWSPHPCGISLALTLRNRGRAFHLIPKASIGSLVGEKCPQPITAHYIRPNQNAFYATHFHPFPAHKAPHFLFYSRILCGRWRWKSPIAHTSRSFNFLINQLSRKWLCAGMKLN